MERLKDPKYGAVASSQKPYNFQGWLTRRVVSNFTTIETASWGLLYKLEGTMHRHSKEGRNRALTWGPWAGHIEGKGGGVQVCVGKDLLQQNHLDGGVYC